MYAAGAGFATRQSGGGYGDYVVVDHGQHGMTLYAHLSSFNIPSGGAWVDQTDVIGAMGSSGTNNVHLHYEKKLSGDWGRGGSSVNPGSMKA